MGLRGSLHKCVLTLGRFAQRPFGVVALAAFAASCSLLLQAQTPTAKVSPVAYGAGSNGVLQAGDQNFYSTSLPLFQNCNTDPNSLCAYIYKMTPGGITSIIHTFGPVPTGSTSNGEGLWPTALIVGTDGFLYGACKSGGSLGLGTIFKVDLNNPDPTTNLTVLKDFGVTGNVPDPGLEPVALIQGSDGNLYFTNGIGVYELTLGASGGAVLTIYSFPPPDPNTNLLAQGGNANSLVQGSDGNFYVTMGIGPQTVAGGSTQGAIGQVTPGGGFNVIHLLAADGSEGDVPIGPLTEGPGGVLYGVTKYSGNTQSAGGWAFSVTTGGAFNLLYQFPGSKGRQYDGALFLGSDGNLYGTTLTGGNTASANCSAAGGCGTFYQLTTSGSYTDLHDFAGGAPNPQLPPPFPIPYDGASPTTPVVQVDNGDFYGTSVGNASSIPIVYKATLTPAPSSGPIQLAFDQPEAVPGSPINLDWTVLNAYSQTAQQCGANIVGNPAGAGNWSGPQKGTLNSAGDYTGTAVITPTANGIYTYALTCGGKESGFVTIKARDNSLLQPITPTAAQLQATVSDTQPYQLDLTAIGGNTPYTWTYVSGTIPPGLSLNSSGTVSGYPQQFGQYSFVVQVTDNSTAALQQNETITINVQSGLMLNPNLFNPVVGKAYSQSMAPDTSGGLQPYTWTLTGGQLPTGLKLDTTTGVISGTPTVAGTFNFTITVSDSEATPDKLPVAFVLKVAGPLQVETSVLPAAAVGVSYTPFQLVASGGTPPYQWTFAPNNPPGSVPQGLSLASDGTITGIPTQYTIAAGGSNTFNVIVSDHSTPTPLSTPAQISIVVNSTLQIQSVGSLNGTVGVMSSVPLVATGGIQPYSFSATATPPNVTLQVIGSSLQFVPTIAGVVNITVSVQDSETFPAKASDNSGSLTVVSPQVPTTTVLASSLPTAGTGQLVTFTAKVNQSNASVTPTGQVTFLNGVNTLGTATLGANGIAAIQTSFAAIGTYNITAAYSGDGTHSGSVSPSLTETVITPGISAGVSPATLTVKAGGSAQFVITATPFGGYTGTISFSCGALPAATTCGFKPPSIAITVAGGPFNAGLTVTTKSGKKGTPSGTYAIPITITVPGGTTQNVGAILVVK